MGFSCIENDDEALLERLSAWLNRMYGEENTVPKLVLVSDGSGCIVNAQGLTLFEFGCLDAFGRTSGNNGEQNNDN